MCTRTEWKPSQMASSLPPPAAAGFPCPACVQRAGLHLSTRSDLTFWWHNELSWRNKPLILAPIDSDVEIKREWGEKVKRKQERNGAFPQDLRCSGELVRGSTLAGGPGATFPVVFLRQKPPAGNVPAAFSGH